jgi:hypothetical protein
MEYPLLVDVYIYQEYLLMVIQEPDAENLGIYTISKKEFCFPLLLLIIFVYRVWLSGVGIADILDGTINGTVHQHMVKYCIISFNSQYPLF